MHYSGSAEDNRRVAALVKDINSYPNLANTSIFFTGDLSMSGSADQFDALMDNFFFGLDDFGKIYTCAGNHDIFRDLTSERKAKKAEKIRNGLVKASEIDNSPFDESCPLNNYSELQHAVSSFQRNGFFTSLDRTENMEVVSINTAWLCRSREPGQTDKGHLCVDESSLDFAVKSLSKTKTKLLMMHHPISWLTHKSQIYIEKTLQRHFDIVLYGHEHDPNSRNLQNENGETVLLQSSAVKANWSHGLNGYSAIKVDTETGAIQVRYRSYSPNREVYIDGNDIVDTGYYYPRAVDKKFWLHELSDNPHHLLERAEAASKVADFKEVFEKSFPSRSKLEHDPIEPMFRTVEFSDGERVSNPRQDIGHCLERVNQHAFFVGPRDSGLTISSYIAYQQICKNIEKFRSIPIYVNLEETSLNKANLIREVQRGAIANYTQREAETLCESGSVFFIFDSVCLQQSEKIEKLKSLLEATFSKCRFTVFCSVDSRVPGLAHDQTINLDPSEELIFEICELTSQEIKAIIDKKASRESETVRENMLNNAVISFKAMDEPIYPTTVSILVDTLKQIPEYKPINRVRLLDRYVECLLGRYSLSDVKVGAFNSSDKSNLLSHIAGKMVSDGVVSYRRDRVETIISEYSEEMWLEIPKDTLQDFMEKGILFEQDAEITFRANYLFSYFVAKEMVRNSKLYSEITQGEKFFPHHNEIVYYGELEGTDPSSLLDQTSMFISDVEKLILSQYETHGISFEKEWKKLTEQIEPEDESLEAVIETIASETPSEHSKEISRAQDLSSPTRSRGVGARGTIQELEAKWLVLLKTYLQLMKHSTSLGGQEKLKHLTKVFESLERFAHNLAVKRDMISVRPMFYYGGILYINHLARIDPEKAKQNFKIAAPASVARLASDLMGSSQLNLALQKASKSAPEFSKFIITTLLLENPAAANKRVITENIIGAQNNSLQIANLRSLKDKYLSYKNDKADTEFYKSVIDDLAKKKALHGAINKSALEKRRRLANLKKGAEPEEE